MKNISITKWFIVIAAVIGAVLFWKNNDKQESVVNNELEVVGQTVNTETAVEESNISVLEFSPLAYSEALASGKLVVLYFYANWCPECKAEFPRFEEAVKELNSDQAVAFRVNYKDNQTEKAEEDLARQYGVAYQHTKVFLRGTKGMPILKDGQSWDKFRYLTEIHKFIDFYDG